MGDLSSPVKKRPCPASDLQLFDDVFSTLVNDITQNGLKEPETHEALEWFKKVLEILYTSILNIKYNVFVLFYFWLSWFLEVFKKSIYLLHTCYLLCVSLIYDMLFYWKQI